MQAVSSRNPNLPLPAGGNADSVSPVISADGRFVLFSSSANNLVPGDNGRLGLDIFLRDRASNTTALVSANFSGTGGGNGNSTAGQVSTNGRYVVFQSDASDLIAGDTNGISDIFVRDLQAGTNILVSVAGDGSWANGASTDPVMTPDGRFVAFVSAASNLVANDTNGLADVFVRDLLNGATPWRRFRSQSSRRMEDMLRSPARRKAWLRAFRLRAKERFMCATWLRTSPFGRAPTP